MAQAGVKIEKIFDKDSDAHELKPAAHTHSTSDVTGLALALSGKANLNHTHTGYAAASHDHDGRYYTETEVDTKLATKAAASHTHDDLYYTETEVDDKIDDVLDRLRAIVIKPEITKVLTGESLSYSSGEGLVWEQNQDYNVYAFTVNSGIRKVHFNGDGGMFMFQGETKEQVVSFLRSHTAQLEQDMVWHGNNTGTCSTPESTNDYYVGVFSAVDGDVEVLMTLV